MRSTRQTALCWHKIIAVRHPNLEKPSKTTTIPILLLGSGRKVRCTRCTAAKEPPCTFTESEMASKYIHIRDLESCLPGSTGSEPTSSGLATEPLRLVRLKMLMEHEVRRC
jgi:hypothetical protein